MIKKEMPCPCGKVMIPVQFHGRSPGKGKRPPTVVRCTIQGCQREKTV